MCDKKEFDQNYSEVNFVLLSTDEENKDNVEKVELEETKIEKENLEEVILNEDEEKEKEYNFWKQQLQSNVSEEIKSENINVTESVQREDNIQNTTDYRGQSNQENSGYRQVPPPPKKSNSFRKGMNVCLAALAFGLIAGISFKGVEYAADSLFPKKQESTQASVEQSKQEEYSKIETTNVLTQVSTESDVSDIVENTMPSIVSITSTVSQPYRDFFGNSYDQESKGSGSGIIIGKNEEELLIVTNNHVIEDAKKIKVTFINDDILDAVVKGKDSSSDLAVIAIDLKDIKKETLESVKIATLGDSTKAKVGEKVLAIGNALGYGQSLTVGYLSAKNREVNVDKNKMTLLQTDAAINPGNSGGALINMRGEVIGINSVKFASEMVEGMGYAIPISSATPIFNELMNKVTVKPGDEGYLGVVGIDVNETVNQMYKIPMGAFVSEIQEGSAAQKAGILEGDVIVKINGMAATTMDSIKEKVNSYEAGTTVKVTVFRSNGMKYEEIEIDVVLQKLDTTVNSKTDVPNTDKGIEQEEEFTFPFGYDFQQ